jgi:hypothetical protein
MDLTTVQSKLEKKEYKSTTQWFHDMCLIYENAIRYHGEESFWGIIAGQLLTDFRKTANGFQVHNLAEWSELLAAKTKKMGTLISSSPVKHGADVLISSCVRRAESLSKFPHDVIPDLIAKLNILFEQEECRHAVLSIITLMQKDPVVTKEDDAVVVDVEKLRDQTLNAINLYVKACE